MPDTPLALIRDTLIYLRDPLLGKQSPFATKQECELFQKKQTARVQPRREPILQTSTKPEEAVETAKMTHRPNSELVTRDGTDSDSISVSKVHFPQQEKIPETSLPPNTEHTAQIKKILQRILPSIRLTDEIPDDEKAKRMANGWKEKILNVEVILLVCDMDAETLDLLKALAKAIDQNLAKPKILMAEKFEKEKRWDLFLEKNTFRLVIASSGIGKYPELMRFYNTPYLETVVRDRKVQIPLLVLSPIPIYNSLEQKALLWKTLCQMLKK